MATPKTETPETEPAPETRRIAFDLAAETWNILQREAAESSITEGRNISISEVARRRIMKGAKVSA